MRGGDTEQCWPWTGSLNAKDGRPYFTCEGVKRPAYVVVLMLTTGEKPDGRVARHKCDNEVCCNPYHLEWGTHQDNMDDMKERERHGLPGIVRKAMLKLEAAGVSHAEIGERYGVSQQAVTQTLKKERERERTGTDEGGEGDQGRNHQKDERPLLLEDGQDSERRVADDPAR